MSATITLPAPTFVNVQIPAAIGAKTIHLNVNYVGCNVSILRTNKNYFSIVARTGLRGMDVVAAQVHSDPTGTVWGADYFDQEAGEYCHIGMSRDLNEMLWAAMNNVSWRGHDAGQW